VTGVPGQADDGPVIVTAGAELTPTVTGAELAPQPAAFVSPTE